MRGDLIDDVDEARALWDGWDALAVARSRPYAAPAWQIGWWEAAAPEGARPLVLAARDGAEVAGIAALYGVRGPTGLERLRFMGAATAQGTAPLLAPGREDEALRALATALAAARPRPATLELEGVPGGHAWAASLCDAWPDGARPRLQRGQLVTSPAVTLGVPDVDAWLASRSSNFRQQMRRSRRKLEDRGVTLRRVTTAAGIQAAVPAVVALHEQRWEDRGGSRAVDAGTAAVLARAAALLGDSGRMHVELAEAEGRTVAAHLFLSAGEEMTYWLGGFDEAFAAERPGLVALVDAIDRALELGMRTLTLGPGDEGYKLRFADTEERLDWGRLVLPGPRRPLTRLQLAPRRLAKRLVRRS